MECNAAALLHQPHCLGSLLGSLFIYCLLCWISACFCFTHFFGGAQGPPFCSFVLCACACFFRSGFSLCLLLSCFSCFVCLLFGLFFVSVCFACFCLFLLFACQCVRVLLFMLFLFILFLTMFCLMFFVV